MFQTRDRPDQVEDLEVVMTHETYQHINGILQRAEQELCLLERKLDLLGWAHVGMAHPGVESFLV